MPLLTLYGILLGRPSGCLIFSLKKVQACGRTIPIPFNKSNSIQHQRSPLRTRGRSLNTKPGVATDRLKTNKKKKSIGNQKNLIGGPAIDSVIPAEIRGGKVFSCLTLQVFVIPASLMETRKRKVCSCRTVTTIGCNSPFRARFRKLTWCARIPNSIRTLFHEAA